jgi:hypothetical protein
MRIAAKMLMAMMGVGLTALAGCTADGNSRVEMGDARIDPTRATTVRGISDSNARPERLTNDSSASLQGLSRAHWDRTTVLVPVDGVEGMPRYLREYPRTVATARQRGEFPTEMTALELSGDSEADQWTETLASPGWHLIQVAALPVRMIMHDPSQCVRHLPQQHWRAQVTTLRQSSAEATKIAELEAAALKARQEDAKVRSDAMDAVR